MHESIFSIHFSCAFGFLEPIHSLLIASIGSSNASAKGIAIKADSMKNAMKSWTAVIALKCGGVFIDW